MITVAQLKLDGVPACREDERTIFPPDDGSSLDLEAVAAAKAVCSTCRFEDQCRSFALTNDVHGIWGGLTGNERRLHRRDRGIPEPAAISDLLDALVLTGRSATAFDDDTDEAMEVA